MGQTIKTPAKPWPIIKNQRGKIAGRSHRKGSCQDAGNAHLTSRKIADRSTRVVDDGIRPFTGVVEFLLQIKNQRFQFTEAEQNLERIVRFSGTLRLLAGRNQRNVTMDWKTRQSVAFDKVAIILERRNANGLRRLSAELVRVRCRAGCSPCVPVVSNVISIWYPLFYLAFEKAVLKTSRIWQNESIWSGLKSASIRSTVWYIHCGVVSDQPGDFFVGAQEKDPLVTDTSGFADQALLHQLIDLERHGRA